MAHNSNHKVVSAADTKTGNTVYLTSCDAWTNDVAVAELLSEQDHDWRLAFARRLREVANARLINADKGEFGQPVLAVA